MSSPASAGFIAQIAILYLIAPLALQAGLGLLMRLWLFPVLNIVVLLGLLPSWFWKLGLYQRWEAVNPLERNYRQRMFTSFALAPGHMKLRAGYADWLCRQWNASAPPGRELAEVQLVSILRPLKLDGEVGEPRGYVERRHACGQAGASGGS